MSYDHVLTTAEEFAAVAMQRVRQHLAYGGINLSPRKAAEMKEAVKQLAIMLIQAADRSNEIATTMQRQTPEGGSE